MTLHLAPSSPVSTSAARTVEPDEHRMVPSEIAPAQEAVDDLLTNAAAGVKPKGVSDYSALSKQVKAEGLLNRTIGFYVRKFAAVSALVALAWTGFFLLGDSPWVLLIAVALGILTAQYGFLAHEASHQQVFSSPTKNKFAGIILADGFAGLAYGWWMVKHSKHHANPNQVAKDPDVGIRVLSFTPESLNEKKGLEGWLARRQGWLFFPLLTLTAFDLLADSARTLFNKHSRVEHRALEITLLLARQLGFLAISFAFLPPVLALGFWLIAMMTFGVFMGGAFAPNHKGMPMLPKNAKVDFLRRQVLTSRNIKGGWIIDNLMGGLNYQIEHHLFPSMPRPHLRRAAELTKAYCVERGIPYYEATLPESYAVVVRYLNRVGLAAADPFDCPLANQLRMGMPQS